MRVVDLWPDKMAAHWPLCGQPGRAPPRDLRNAGGQRAGWLTAVWAGISRACLSREINLSGPAAGQQTQPEKAPCSGLACHPSLSVWNYRGSETWQGKVWRGGVIADRTDTSEAKKRRRRMRIWHVVWMKKYRWAYSYYTIFHITKTQKQKK